MWVSNNNRVSGITKIKYIATTHKLNFCFTGQLSRKNVILALSHYFNNNKTLTNFDCDVLPTAPDNDIIQSVPIIIESTPVIVGIYLLNKCIKLNPLSPR